jgi:hypothetical protein
VLGRCTEVGMNDYSDAAVRGTGDRFAIGQPVPRSEDPVLLWGDGHYRGDFNRLDQLYAPRSIIPRSLIAPRVM